MKRKLFPDEQQLVTSKILIVDDEQAHVRLLEWVLKKANYANVVSLTDPTKAREEFIRFQPDLLLLDWNMPELDGCALLGQLQGIIPLDEFIPVLVLTGNNTAETRAQALAAGAHDFLGKPLDYTEVMLRIRNLLQTRCLHRQVKDLQAQLASIQQTAME